VDYSLKQGDTGPIGALLADARGPLDLTGCTVEFLMRAVRSATNERLSVEGAATILSPTRKGRVLYPWAEGETDTVGDYRVEWAVTDPFGRRQTYPPDSYQTLQILTCLVSGSGSVDGGASGGSGAPIFIDGGGA
jgi:hypothetical protein